jgi:hypothetical protein
MSPPARIGSQGSVLGVEGMLGAAAAIALILIWIRWKTRDQPADPLARVLRFSRFVVGSATLMVVVFGGIWSFTIRGQTMIGIDVPRLIALGIVILGLTTACLWLIEFWLVTVEGTSSLGWGDGVGQRRGPLPGDPGWIPAFRYWLSPRRASPSNTLIEMRAIVVIAIALLTILSVFVILALSVTRMTGVLVPIVAAAGCAGLAVSIRGRDRTLDGRDPVALASTFRSSTMRGMTYSWSGAFTGVALGLLGGGILTYILGAFTTAMGFLLVAPTRAELGRRQDALTQQGSSLSLLAALKDSR